MLTTHTNFSLKSLNTFGLEVQTSQFLEPNTIEELVEALNIINNTSTDFLVLGGGSNILFKSDFKGVVIHPNILGIEVVSEDAISATVKAGAGVEWDKLVDFVVEMGLGGLENLSLIPGNVGASPIQNIGAYGVEAKDCIEFVEGLNIKSLIPFTLTNAECKFGYRDSIFKNELKGKVVVTQVFFKLLKTPKLITHYGNLDDELKSMGDRNLRNVRQAVINIRNSKLPDPKVLGNAGSFFKNPVVDIALVQELKERYDKVPFFPVNENSVKLPAGWLIEQCGWKGKRVGNTGVHKNQALVLVNYGGALGTEILDLAHDIRQSVMQQFNVSLEMEVNVV